MMQRIAVPVFVIALLAGVAVVILLLRDGDDSEPALVAAPSATMAPPATPTPPWPGPPATATPETLPTLPPTEGTLVYLLDNDLWVAPLDQSAPPTQITSGSYRVQYAGHIRRADGTLMLYFVNEVSEEEFVLYKTDSTGGMLEALHQYSSRRLESNASVSPDGRFALLAEDNGMVLLDVVSGEVELLLANSPPCAGPANCFSYRLPRWSPVGGLAIISKIGWEGGQDFIIDPLTGLVDTGLKPGEVRLSGRWAQDGSRICGSELNYVDPGAILVNDLATGETVDATLDITFPTPEYEVRVRIETRDCAWARSGGLAFGFRAPGDIVDASIAVVDNTNQLRHVSEPVPNLSRVVEWLPDDSGVLYNAWHAQGGGLRPPGVYDPDRGLFRLPFEADTVLAVIP